jgi:hypothetical protein
MLEDLVPPYTVKTRPKSWAFSAHHGWIGWIYTLKAVPKSWGIFVISLLQRFCIALFFYKLKLHSFE